MPIPMTLKALATMADGDEDHEQQEDFPEAALEKIAENNPQGKQGQNIAQPAAGFHHLHLPDTQIYDIALTKGRDSHHLQHGGGQAGGD